MQIIQGVGASAGIAVAPILVIEDQDVVVPDHPDPQAALVEAGASVAAHLGKLGASAEEKGRSDAAEVLQAQALMAEDSMIADAVEEHLAAGVSFDQALTDAASELEAMLASLDDPYLAARAADVKEVTDRLRRELAGLGPTDEIDLSEPSILCATRITAAETANLDPELVVGFATTEGGPTSHVAIIARSIGVPAVVGVLNLTDTAVTGALGALDGSTGELVIGPDAETQSDFAARARLEAEKRAAAEKFRGVRVQFDGRPVHVSANVANLADVERAVEAGADGVGLMRTEFLFMDRPEPPSEDEQVEVYSTVLKAFREPVVIRTFDIGGDKPADFLTVEAEENPFLGVRGVRLYGQEQVLFRTQVRALLRASVHGDLWVMIPMVATVSEMLEVREHVDEVREELQVADVSVGRISLGVMIEVPSAALLAAQLAPHADFFSIGTNDLTQYTMAADRMSGALDYLHDPVHPAVMRLCQMTAEAGQASGRPVSVCGLAAADPVAAALFVEMGISKLSVSSPSVNQTKSMVDSLENASLVRAASGAREAPDAEQSRATVHQELGWG